MCYPVKHHDVLRAYVEIPTTGVQAINETIDHRFHGEYGLAEEALRQRIVCALIFYVLLLAVQLTFWR